MSLHSIKAKSTATSVMVLLTPSRIRSTKSWIWTLLSPFDGNLAVAMPMKFPKRSSGIGSVVLDPTQVNCKSGDGWPQMTIPSFSHLHESIPCQCYHDFHSCRLAFQQLRTTNGCFQLWYCCAIKNKRFNQSPKRRNWTRERSRWRRVWIYCNYCQEYKREQYY